MRRIYVAQPFWRTGRSVRAGRLYGFTCAVDAMAGAEVLARTAAGVVAYQQDVDMEAEIWDEPDLLGVWGRVPRSAIEAQAVAA